MKIAKILWIITDTLNSIKHAFKKRREAHKVLEGCKVLLSDNNRDKMLVNEIQRNFSYVTFFMFRSTKASLIARYVISQSSHVNKRFLSLVRLSGEHSQATRDAIVPVHTCSLTELPHNF